MKEKGPATRPRARLELGQVTPGKENSSSVPGGETVLPKHGPVTTQPALQLAPSESHTLIDMVSASPQWGAENTLSQHLDQAIEASHCVEQQEQERMRSIGPTWTSAGWAQT